MGATNFAVIGKGKTAREAFGLLVQEARYMHGHGGYTGTIAEKGSFVVITETVETLVKRVATVRLEPYFNEPAEHVENRRRSIIDRLEEAKNDPPASRAHAIADALIELNDKRIDDKWGPAGCIRVADGEWLFFGWASE